MPRQVDRFAIIGSHFVLGDGFAKEGEPSLRGDSVADFLEVIFSPRDVHRIECFEVLPFRIRIARQVAARLIGGEREHVGISILEQMDFHAFPHKFSIANVCGPI